jgi:hypothetical protein
MVEAGMARCARCGSSLLLAKNGIWVSQHADNVSEKLTAALGGILC